MSNVEKIAPTDAQSALIEFARKEGLVAGMEVMRGIPASRKEITDLLIGRAGEQFRGVEFVENLREKINNAFPEKSTN